MVKKTLTRESLANKLNKTLGFSKILSKNIVSDIFENLIYGIEDNKEVKISSFGTFKKIEKKERIGRNPKTKIVAKISSRKVVKFKPSSFVSRGANVARS